MNKRLEIVKSILMLICIVTLFSCCSKNAGQINKKLIGTWVLDSELYARGGMHKVSLESRVFKFFDDGSYSYETWQGDVNGQSYGNYFILNNPNHKFSTISFIPNLQDGYMSYMNYDITSVSDSFLKLAEPTRLIMNDDKKSSSMFNGLLIYRKHK